jgi:hypothetical protein
MKRTLIVILSAISLCLFSSLFAETIILKSGKTVEGKLIEKTNEYIKLKVGELILTYYLDEIAQTHKDSRLENPKPKKTVVYKVSKKFYLKALEDVHFLKFCMPLPIKNMVHQKITDIRSFPKMNAFIRDSAGSDLPIFYFEFLKSGTTAITGVTYTVELDATPLAITPFAIADAYHSGDEQVKQYLGNEADINIKNPVIQETMLSVTGSIKNPYEKARALYDFITKNIRYDYELFVKTVEGVGVDTSRKPEETLQYRRGICYDIAKLYVALVRAAGIPARVIRGITFEPKGKKGRSVDNYGHAWAEIYLPPYGWLTVDPTYGISKKNSFFCFDNTTHIAEEYGLISIGDFGSFEKGWALQIRTQNQQGRFPLGVDMLIEIERISE